MTTEQLDKLKTWKSEAMSSWTRIRLFFTRRTISWDLGDGSNDYSAKVHYKQLDGKVYVVKVEYL